MSLGSKQSTLGRLPVRTGVMNELMRLNDDLDTIRTSIVPQSKEKESPKDALNRVGGGICNNKTSLPDSKDEKSMDCTKDYVYVDLDHVPSSYWHKYEASRYYNVVAACAKNYKGPKPSFVWTGTVGTTDEADCLLLVDFCSRWEQGKLQNVRVRFLSCDKIFPSIKAAAETILPEHKRPKEIVIETK
jgi:hypothetical protein